MPNTVIAIRQSGETGNTPSLGVLANGELAINYADGILYYKTSSNTLGSILTATPGGLDTEVQFNDGGSFGGDSGFTYNKTTETITVTNVKSTFVNTSTLNTNTLTVQTINGDVILSGNLVPNADDTHFLGNTAFTFKEGHFDDLYVDGNIYVRASVNLADGDRVDFGTSQDVKLYYDGTLNQMNVELQGDSTRLKITDNNTDRFTFYKANGDFYATGNVYATNVYDGGVEILTVAQAAFDQANTANTNAAQAAVAFDKANSANILAQAAFNQANTAIGDSLAFAIALG
jgi:hypothetical protein